MPSELYPFVFRPVIASSPHPGGLMRDYLAGAYGEFEQAPGEIWLLFDDGKHSSAIANGPLAKMMLSDLVQTRTEELVGDNHDGANPFPLVVRLIDTGVNQPLQVHPDVTMYGDHSTKTNAKFWYSLAADAGARIIVGIAQQVTNQQILLNLDKPGFERLLQRYPGRPGDSFLIPPGFVHSIGAGNLVLEIQQRYLKPLVLQTGADSEHDQPLDKQAALDAINREARTNLRVSRESGSASHTRKINLTRTCPYFHIEEVRLHDHIFLRTHSECFHLLVVTRGQLVVCWKQTRLKLSRGMLCCIPACCGDYKVETAHGNSEFLRMEI